MMSFAIPAAYAVLVWWFATGAILFLDGLPRRTFRWSIGAATAVLTVVVAQLHSNAGEVNAVGAYKAFTGAILIWGWIEMTFLMGFITGPRKHACAASCSGWRHFVHASQAIIFNELATLAGAMTIAAVTHGAPNQLALQVYLMLWVMRLSAKLNLFLGVRNLGDQFLPAHLQYLKSFFRRRPMNMLFPVSISLSSTGAVLLIRRFLVASNSFSKTADALLASLLALAILEHWMMVVPLPGDWLWGWAMRPATRRRNAEHLDSRASAIDAATASVERSW